MATPAQADGLVAVQSPTGNIHGDIYRWQSAPARCDVRKLVPTCIYRPPGPRP
jgi:hypothetical protein